ncbi:MAG: hypothetical protein KDD64_01130 [Bdellovibrionales bacterium]|nr:hypothetical protein [Bdellovibrionales bacterium]
MVRRNIFIGVCAVAVIGLLASTGCGGGGTDGDSGTDFGGIFVASDSTVGKIEVQPNSSTLAVGATTGFSVQVSNQSGAGVPNIQVACDSESGLAIIEPADGNELTDGSGFMSGTIGCRLPGSFQFACRLPIGTNLREFETIICTGGIPAGFDGFAGAAGGSLGGGVQTPSGGSNAGGSGVDGIELTSINVVTEFGSSSFTPEIDTTQVNCDDTGEEQDCEAFSDDVVQFSIQNNTNQSVRFTSYNYTVPNADGAGSSFTSVSLSLNSVLVAPGGGETGVQALFIEIRSGGSGACSLQKRFPDASFNIPGDLGFRNITFRLNGETEGGDSVTLVGRATVSFDNFDNC